MDKRFWTIIGVIVLAFAGIIFFNNKKSSDTSTKSNSQPTQHFQGNVNAKVQLQEYGDFQCPVCEGYYPVVQQVEEKYKDTVRFQFSNLPLLQAHPNAFAASRAAEAASNQGKFWEMHDALYDSQHYYEWAYDPNAGTVRSADPMPYFKQYAKQIGLDMTKFQTDFASSAVNDRINADINAFKKTKQSLSTPSFFINGKYYSNSNFADSTGAPSLDAFSKVLDKALKDAGVTPNEQK